MAAIRNFFVFIFKPIGRTILIGLSGQLVFIVSVITMIPLRMAKNPVANYNLFYVPILAIIFLVLFYRTCTEEDEGRGILYGFYAALVAWPVIGEIASIPVEKGIITQFSGVDIKLLGAYYYVVAGWLMLKIMWRTKAVKNSLCVFFMVFLCIWTFELYMENYTAKVPIEMMPVIANWVTIVFSVLSIVVLVFAWRTTSVVKKNVMGCLFYITIALIIMGSGQWKKPSDFYLKYESKHIGHEIEELKEEQEYLKFLTKYMIEEGLVTPEELGLSDNEISGDKAESETSHK